VAFVPQSPIVPPGMSVASYVLLGRTPHLGPLGREGAHDLGVVARTLEQLDLTAFAERPLDTLSGGERQRAMVARALAQEAPVLLLDEPTTALDVGHQQEVLELVDRLRREHELTVVSTMHDLTLAGQYADRLLLLDHGQVVVSGPPEEVLTQENLARFYGARVRVLLEGGALVVVPVRAGTPVET
jgi:iron complex transport system ATP-binding protein